MPAPPAGMSLGCRGRAAGGEGSAAPASLHRAMGPPSIDHSTLPEPPALGLLTGNIRLGAEIKLRHFELWEVFQTGAFGDDHEDRDQIAALAKERGSLLLNNDLSGEQILVIGDTPRDIECARAIDARTLAVATGGVKFEELETHKPDWLVKDLTTVVATQVCGAR